MELVEISERLQGTAQRLKKTAVLAAWLHRLERTEIAIGVHYMSGRLPQGRIGIGARLLAAAAQTAPACAPTLTLVEIDAALARLAEVRGAGSGARRRALLAELYARATRPEQEFLYRLLTGELRQGALEGLMLEAVAAAADIDAAEVRRAAMLAGDLPPVAEATLAEGRSGLARFRLTPLAAVKPMLAQTAANVEEALARLGKAAFEFKLDGVRVQVHKAGDAVRVYTRRLQDVTDSVPEIVDAVRGLDAGRLILDGEAISCAEDGRPRPFQETMRRFGRKQGVNALRAELPLSVLFFDCLHLDGRDLVGEPASARFEALAAALPAGLQIPRCITADADEARAFLEHALARGHEGLVAKALDAPYAAGDRGGAWLKIKVARTLDLVVLAAEWGHGRRRGWLSNLHLGARDPGTGGFVMLGKTFKGMTDEMLRWQTERLLALERRRDAHTVYVRPELVVEVAFDGLQQSPQYPGGLALRFARVKSYRTDKAPEDADTIEAVKALYVRQNGRV